MSIISGQTDLFTVFLLAKYFLININFLKKYIYLIVRVFLKIFNETWIFNI